MNKKIVFFITFLGLISKAGFPIKKSLFITSPFEEKLLSYEPEYLQKIATLLVIILSEDEQAHSVLEKIKNEERETLSPIEHKKGIIKAHRHVLKLIEKNEAQPFHIKTVYKRIRKRLQTASQESGKTYVTFLYGKNKGDILPEEITITIF